MSGSTAAIPIWITPFITLKKMIINDKKESELSMSSNYTQKKIAIINGYASDKITYNNNNRIKTVSRTIYDHDGKNIIEKKLLSLKDDILDYQIFEWNCDTVFHVDSIYNGTKYNDTCISEVNFYCKDLGWIFGEIDE